MIFEYFILFIYFWLSMTNGSMIRQWKNLFQFQAENFSGYQRFQRYQRNFVIIFCCISSFLPLSLSVCLTLKPLKIFWLKLFVRHKQSYKHVVLAATEFLFFFFQNDLLIIYGISNYIPVVHTRSMHTNEPIKFNHLYTAHTLTCAHTHF